jgi:hypothetical protein
MVIVIDSLGKRITDFGTNSLFPDGVPYEPQPGEYIYRINDNDPLVQDILSAGSIQGVIVNGVVGSVVVYKRISVTVDKPQITANGTDTATITATVDDPVSTEPIEFYDSAGTLIQTVACVNGQAQMPITATVAGDIVVAAKSTTKYGQNQILIKAV